MKQQYRDQVALLLEVLPSVAKVKNFILKGGTAINLFVQDFPRLSVDIDLVYLPLDDRQATLNGIQAGLLQIRDNLKIRLPNILIKENYNKQTQSITRLDIIRDNALVKIEPNLILRGSVFEPISLDLKHIVQQDFGVSIFDVPIANPADLYAGKICAALDRQHPRDLFDIKILLEQAGITSNIKQAFLVYLCSHNRPMHELLQPNFLDQKQTFLDEFQGMTKEVVTYDELEKVRESLIQELHKVLTLKDKEFLLSFKEGKPNWQLLGIDVSNLPGIKWKQINLNKMESTKHQAALKKLHQVLYDRA